MEALKIYRDWRVACTCLVLEVKINTILLVLIRLAAAKEPTMNKRTITMTYLLLVGPYYIFTLPATLQPCKSKKAVLFLR